MIALTCSHTSNRRAFRTREYCALFEVFLSGVVWSFAVIWLNIAGEAKLDLVSAIGLGMFVMFFMLLLVTGAKVIDDSK